MALGRRSSASTDPDLRATAYSKTRACSVLTKINTSSLLDELYRVLSVVQGIKYCLLPAKFLVLFFPRLVQEPSERCREKP